MNKKKLFFLLVLIAGFLYRVYMVSRWNFGLVWDSVYYSYTAIDILNGVHKANCCNITAGYPFIIAILYRIFGVDNIVAVKMFQAVLDTVTAVLVYKIAQKLRPQSALPAFILYLANPLTASYTGVVLTEIPSLFFVSLSVFIVSRSGFIKRPLYWFLFGLSLGYLTFTKSAFYLFSFGFIGCSTLLLFHYKKWLKFLLITLVGFGVVSLYTIITMYTTFGVISIVPPYRSLYGSLYTSFYLGRSGELSGEPVTVAPEYTTFITDYFRYYNNNPKELLQFDAQFKPKFYEKLKTDWKLFLQHWFRNAVWTLDKYHLGSFNDPWYPNDSLPIRVVNIIFLVIHGIGFAVYSIRKRTLFHPIQVYTGLLFFYIIGTFSMINNESRLSMPYYPLAFVWAGYAVSEAIRVAKKMFILRHAQD
jgi:hypothetical protein